MQFLTNSTHMEQPVLGREPSSPEQPIPRRARREGPMAKGRTAEQQKAKRMKPTQQKWTRMVLPRTALLKSTALMNERSRLPWHTKHDADGMGCSPRSAWMSAKVCPSVPPSLAAPHLADRKPRETLVSLVTVIS